MQRAPVREFGKRQPVRRAIPAAPVPCEIPAEHAAVFTAIRHGLGDAIPAQQRAVPRSFNAALLAGLVTAFFMAGLDIGQPSPVDAALQPLLDRVGIDGFDQARPIMIALSLLGGARAAVTALLIAHRLLAKVGHTSLAAYALGGAAANAIFAEIIMAISGIPPHHGWPLEIAAGAITGFFYRLFAGAKRGYREDLSRVAS
jgi:hypothetical protein